MSEYPAWWDDHAVRLIKEFPELTCQRRAHLQLLLIEAMKYGSVAHAGTGGLKPTLYTIEHEKLADEQYMAWLQVRGFAVRAHQICNLLRVAHPEIGELADDGCLHQAIHDLMRVDWPVVR